MAWCRLGLRGSSRLSKLLAKGFDQLRVLQGLLAPRQAGAPLPPPYSRLVYPTSAGDLSDGQLGGLTKSLRFATGYGRTHLSEAQDVVLGHA